MPGLVKTAVVVAGVLVALCIVAVVLVKVLVTPEKIRETVLPLAEDTLQRKVELGEIEIGLLSGVSLRNLKVQNKDGSGDFISVRTLELSYQFWPLLCGQVAIDRVLLEQPKISVVRNPDGSFNFSDLLGEEHPETDASAAGKGETTTEQSSSNERSIDLLVSEVAIKSGELLFVDRTQNAQSPYRYRLEKLDLHAAQITFDRPFPLKLSALLNKSKIDLSGRYDLAKQSGSFNLMLEPLDLIQFAPYYRSILPGSLGSALLALDVELDLTPEKLSTKGKLSLDRLDLRLNGLPEAQLEEAKLVVDHAISFHLSRQQLDLSTLFIDFNGIKLGADGTVVLAGEEPQINLALLLDKLDLRKLMQGLPAGLTKAVQSYSLAGLVNGRIELAGKPSAGPKLLKAAKLNLADVQASVDNLRTGVSGDIDYADAAVKAEQLQLKLGDQQASLSFSASNLFGKIIRGEFQLTADRLDSNKLLPAAPPQQSVEPDGASNGQASSTPPVERAKTGAEEIGPFDIPLDMTGSLAVNKLRYAQLTLDQVQADLTLKNNRLKISRLRSGVAGGELLAATEINLGVKGLSYQGEMSLKQSNLINLVAGILPEAGDSVSGLLHWQNNFSGRGTIPDHLLKALQVKGALQLARGKVTGSPLLEQLAGFLGSPDLKVLSFNAFQGNYDLRDGLVHLTADLDSSKARLRPAGTVGLDGSLNMSLDARLAPEVMANLGAKGGLQQALTDENGWGMLPLKIRGSYLDPKFGIDEKILKRQAASKAKQEVKTRLLEKIAPKGDSNSESVRQLLDGPLKKLFGN